jgi:hypothetical protein
MNRITEKEIAILRGRQPDRKRDLVRDVLSSRQGEGEARTLPLACFRQIFTWEPLADFKQERKHKGQMLKIERVYWKGKVVPKNILS